MCFSASASFGASVLLTGIGVVTLKKTTRPAHLLFAAIPFIFGLQQFAEGMIWMTVPNSDYAATQKFFTYVYLFFAQILWPIWIPIAILLLEKDETRRRTQKLLIGAGFIVAAYLGYCLFNFDIQAKIVGHHITYLQVYPAYIKNGVIIFYALATIAPPFFSHIKHMWILGSTILLSYLITEIFYDHYVLSVWCFFSSIISIAVYAIMNELAKDRAKKV